MGVYSCLYIGEIAHMYDYLFVFQRIKAEGKNLVINLLFFDKKLLFKALVISALTGCQFSICKNR